VFAFVDVEPMRNPDGMLSPYAICRAIMPVHLVDEVELVRYCTVRPFVPLEDACKLTVATDATTMMA
jgi:hypothetical protein